MQPQPSPRRSILVVDDSAAERDAIAELLQHEGFEVLIAHDGEDALSKLRGGARPDVILLDLVMERMSGWEFRVAQRDEPAIAHIPIIAVSGETSAAAKAIDARSFVPKPVSRGRLLAAIRAVLHQSESERLEQMEKLASLGRLAASVAHEMNNPLAFAKSNLAYVEQELMAPLRNGATVRPERIADCAAALSEAQEGLDRIELILKDILLFGRTSGGGEQLIDVAGPVRLALKVAGGRLRSISVKMEEEPTPQVRADPSRLAQVVLNLLVNAADALMERDERDRRLTVRIRAIGEQVELAVTDTGPGIAAHVKARLFEPFFTTKPSGLGTGLGLFVCRGLVDAMGGHIEVESELGQGSSFRVLLPRAGPAH